MAVIVKAYLHSDASKLSWDKKASLCDIKYLIWSALYYVFQFELDIYPIVFYLGTLYNIIVEDLWNIFPASKKSDI